MVNQTSGTLTPLTHALLGRKRKGIFLMWDSKPKKITSATLGLEAKIAPIIKGSF